MKGIIVADDERAARAAVCAVLRDAGHDVREARNGEEALRLYSEERPALLLLDVMMPRLDGWETCRRIRRADGMTPVVFLTALDGEEAMLRGFGLGADDFIRKTASSAELLARISAAMRRAGGSDAVGFDFGEWRVDASALRLSRGDRRVDLTEREVAMLRFFKAHPGEKLTRDFLLTKFWGGDFPGGDGALSMAMVRLRAKLGRSGRMIVTAPRVGYYCADLV